MLVAFYQHSYDEPPRLAAQRRHLPLRQRRGEAELKNERGIHHVGVPITAATVEAIGGSAQGQGQEHLRARPDLRRVRPRQGKARRHHQPPVRQEGRERAAQCPARLRRRLCLPGRRPREIRVRARRGAGTANRISTDGNQMLSHRPARGGRALRRGLSDHAVVAASWRRCAASCRNTAASSCRPRTKSPPISMAIGASLRRSPRRHRQQRPRASRSRWRRSAGPSWRKCRSSSSTCSAAARPPACRRASSRAT